MGLNLPRPIYQHRLDIGISSSPDIVENPWEIIEAFRTEAEQLSNDTD